MPWPEKKTETRTDHIIHTTSCRVAKPAHPDPDFPEICVPEASEKSAIHDPALHLYHQG